MKYIFKILIIMILINMILCNYSVFAGDAIDVNNQEVETIDMNGYRFPKYNTVFGKVEINYPDISLSELKGKDNTSFFQNQGNFDLLEQRAYYVLKYGEEGLSKDIMSDSVLEWFISGANNSAILSKYKDGSAVTYVLDASKKLAEASEKRKNGLEEEMSQKAQNAWDKYERDYKNIEISEDASVEYRLEKAEEIRKLGNILETEGEKDKASLVYAHADQIESGATSDAQTRNRNIF